DVPVVVRLQVHQARTLARRIHQPAVGERGQRQPVLEVRVGHERVIAVVEYVVVAASAGHDQVLAAAAGQGLVGAGTQGGQVLGIEDGKVGGVHRRQLRRKVAILPERSEEHTSELQSRENLVCRLLLEKKKT